MKKFSLTILVLPIILNTLLAQSIPGLLKGAPQSPEPATAQTDPLGRETPSGTINGVNNLFTLTQSPNPAASLALYRSGVKLRSVADYSISGNTVIFVSGHVPQTGDMLQCYYRVAQ